MESWTRWFPEVPSNPYCPVILWKTDLACLKIKTNKQKSQRRFCRMCEHQIQKAMALMLTIHYGLNFPRNTNVWLMWKISERKKPIKLSAGICQRAASSNCCRTDCVLSSKIQRFEDKPPFWCLTSTEHGYGLNKHLIKLEISPNFLILLLAFLICSNW